MQQHWRKKSQQEWRAESQLRWKEKARQESQKGSQLESIFVGHVLKGELEEEEMAHHSQIGFPVDDEDRPVNYQRSISGDIEEARKWMQENMVMLGDAYQDMDSDLKDKVALVMYTWRDLFAEDVRGMPETRLVTHRIPTYPWVTPSAAKIPLYTPEEEAWMEENLPPMRDANIIAACVSPWCAKTKFPRKSSGKLRMVHQYIKLNQATIPNSYPMKRIEPILNKLGSKKLVVFFKADAANGYWAVRLEPEHAGKTGFGTIFGQFCYLRMGQGLTGAPGSYTRLKDLAMGPIPDPLGEPALGSEKDSATFMHFMDDDQGGAESAEELLVFLHLRYFPRLAWSGLTLNPKKTTFFSSSIGILGHNCTKSGLRPSVDKIQALMEWPEPSNEQELFRFTYVLPFLKAYIPGRADLVRTMKGALTYEGKGGNKQLVHFHWGEPQQKAFKQVKNFIQNMKLSGGDKNLQYHLSCDASNYGIGGYLFQIEDTPVGARSTTFTRGKERPIMFLSFALSDTESRYHTTEKETLAVLRCLEEVRWLVKGANYPTIVYTDHRAVMSVLGAEPLAASDKVMRWQYRLQEYDLDIVHVPGKLQVVADGLSRIPGRWGHHEEEEGLSFPAFHACDARAGRGEGRYREEEDHQVEDFMIQLEGEEWYKELVCRWKQGEEKHQRGDERFKAAVVSGDAVLLFQEKDGRYARCIMKHELTRVLFELHDVHGHFAAKITLGRAIGKYYWPARWETVRKYCQSCHQCQVTAPKLPQQVPHPIAVMEPMDLVGMDYIGPINPPSVRGNRYIAVSADYLSRFTFGEATPEATAGFSFNFLQNNVARVFGWPGSLYTDNGSHFTGAECHDRVEAMGTRHILAPVTAPWSVGLLERIVQLVIAGLRAFVAGDPGNVFEWDKFLSMVIQSINSRVLDIHGFTPAELLLGISPRYFGPLSVDQQPIAETLQSTSRQWEGEPSKEVNLATMASRVERVHEVRESLRDHIAKTKKIAEPNRTFKKGDLVLLRRIDLDQSKGRKLEARWAGPFIVHKLLKQQRSCLLRDLASNLTLGKYHIDHLKLFVHRSENGIEEAQELQRSSAAQRQQVDLYLKSWREEKRKRGTTVHPDIFYGCSISPAGPQVDFQQPN